MRHAQAKEDAVCPEDRTDGIVTGKNLSTTTWRKCFVIVL